ncbi:MAG: hypothetical protein CMN84_11960 [Spongiibacteraceae bacterium]|jgi:prepilin peptidase CpaA|nr:hypothetical protein [Spongiibacteraceae bacterium]
MDVIAVMDLALLVVAACMAIIAWQDWTQRRIANWAVLVLFGCAALRWNLTSPSVSELMFNVIIALLISVPGLMKAALGAGDVKLLFALAPLWTTDTYFQAFSFGLVILITICLVADLFRSRIRPAMCTGNTTAGRRDESMYQLRERGIPLGTALSLGWITTLL